MTTNREHTLSLVHIVRKPRQPDTGQISAEGGPGLLLLHGRGADENDLMGLEAALDPRLTVISVRAPARFRSGYAWYGVTPEGKPDHARLKASLAELRVFVAEAASAYGLDSRRIYAMGFSEGAVIAAALSLTDPDLVRATIMHSGYVPVDAGLDLSSDGMEGKPFFLAHGRYDDVIPAKYGRDSYAYLLEQGARALYNEYPIGHSISEESLYELSEWLTGALNRAVGE